MIKKLIAPVVSALAVGTILGVFLFGHYDKKELKTVGNTGIAKEVYFLQIGVYSSKENMESNVSKIGMSLKEENAQKLKDFFISIGYNIYVKKFGIANQAFLTVLDQYDTMLEQAPDTSSYSAICGQVLAKYEELINHGSEDQGTA